MPTARSYQRSYSATPHPTPPSSSGLASPSPSETPAPPVSLLSQAHEALKAARKPPVTAVRRGPGPSDRLRRGFSIFKDDFLPRPVSGGSERIREENEDDNGQRLGRDRPSGGLYTDTADMESADMYFDHGREGEASAKDMDASTRLRKQGWWKSSRGMYVAHIFLPPWPFVGLTLTLSRHLGYYFPFFDWIRQYKWSYVRGDLVAALTMASMYIPMALSLAENLGHVPPINGLYSFVFNPVVYALLGTCPQMVVGPEAAGSLLLGTVIKTSIDHELSGEEDLLMHARIAGVVTGMAGAVIFIAGMMRLGFLEGILSRPFLRGFISAIGFVILADQLIPEMGLSHRAKQVHATHGSSVDKLVFLAGNISHAHGLTCAVAFGSFAIIMVLR